MKFNPKLEDFLKENETIGLIGFGWSLWWRIMVLVYGIVFAAYFVVGFADAFIN